MQLFTVIDDMQAIIRLPKGVHKQVKLYRRGDRVYVPHGGGFVEVRNKELHTGWWTTGHPDVKLVEHDRNGNIHSTVDGGLSSMRWRT